MKDIEQATKRSESRTVALSVISHLEELIFAAGAQSGDLLPSESELAKQLSVSRLTVREAIRGLESRGLIAVAHGKRPSIAHPNATPLHDFFSAGVRRDARGLLELLDVRLAIEVHCAELAATNRNRSELSLLESSLDGMRRSEDDEEQFNNADVRFHAAIASASGNRLLNFLVEGMEGPLQLSRLQSLRGFKQRGLAFENLVQQHVDIFAKIVARDSVGAGTAMRRHLLRTRVYLRSAIDSLQVKPSP